jgi:hypothetical protein
MSDSSKSEQSKSARSLRRTTSTRTIKISYTYFLKDRFNILNSVFFSLLEAIGKYKRKTEVIQSQGWSHEDAKRRVEAAENKRSSLTALECLNETWERG